MKVLKTHKIVMCDIDDTLILWDKSKYPGHTRITVKYGGFESELVVHKRNRNLFIKLAKLGYTMIVWSMTGYDWAKTIVEALELEKYTTLCLTKPRLYVDDKDAARWMGERVYRNPNGDSNE